MKYIPLILTLIFTLPLASQMEFEEVLQLYPEGNVNSSYLFYLKGDSAFTIYHSTGALGDISHFKLTTNSGNTWRDLDNLFEDLDIAGADPYNFHLYSFSETDSTLYHYNFDGEVIYESEYLPHHKNGYLRFNPIDPNFLGLHIVREYLPFELYQHYFYYSTDYGKNWNLVNVEKYLLEEKNLTLPYNVTIGFAPNLRNKNKTLFQFNWHNMFGTYFSMTGNFDFYTEEMRFYDNNTLGSCYGCLSEDEVIYNTKTQDSIIRYNLETKEKNNYSRFPNSIGWDPDSISENNEGQDLKLQRFRVNSSNPSHQIMLILYSEYDKNSSPRYNFIHQYFFQSFDSGNTWEFLYLNEDRFNIIDDFYINSKDLSLWLVKNIHDAHTNSPYRLYPILYRSLSPVTSVKNIPNNTELSAYFNKNTLVINSKKNLHESQINIYNLLGKETFKTKINLTKGNNQIYLNDNLTNGLYFIVIENNYKKSIVKLIRSD